MPQVFSSQVLFICEIMSTLGDARLKFKAQTVLTKCYYLHLRSEYECCVQVGLDAVRMWVFMCAKWMNYDCPKAAQNEQVLCLKQR